MLLPRFLHKLAEHMNRISNVRASDREINESPNKVGDTVKDRREKLPKY